ncbi:hypothetical protein [Lysinibacillus mangiferihumi]|nr:hypothetical protein [Lysinibacillus mangiferihumi]
MEIAYKHYKMNGETIACKKSAFFNKLGRFDVVWDTSMTMRLDVLTRAFI